MVDAAVETELKFLAPTRATAAELFERLPPGGQTTVSRFQSTYFDTPRRHLRRVGLSLRLRRTPDGFIQTVKSRASGPIQRGEWEHPVRSAAIDMERLADTPACKAARGSRAIFATDVERTSRIIEVDGSRVRLSFDRGEISTGTAREPILELELELETGKTAALFQLARALNKQAPLRLSFDSKAERGYRLCEGNSREARKSEDPAPRLGQPASEAFQAIGLACLAQVTSNAELLRVVARPEALHQIRIGLRRLRTATAVFKTMLADADRERVEAGLKWLAGELNQARDLDVFGHSIFGAAAKTSDATGLDVLGLHLLGAKTAAYHRATAAIESARYRTLVVETAAWIQVGAWVGIDDAVLADLRSAPIEQVGAKALTHLRRLVLKRGRGLDCLDPESRHKLRIRAKRLRYAVEFFGPLYSGRKRRGTFLDHLEGMQDRLGELNDIAVARDRLLGEGAVKTPEVAFAAGRAVGRRDRDEAKLLRAAVKGYEAFRKSRPFWS